MYVFVPTEFPVKLSQMELAILDRRVYAGSVGAQTGGLLEELRHVFVPRLKRDQDGITRR